MDALEFIKERNRMCDYYTKKDGPVGCADCPVWESPCHQVQFITAKYIAAVEQWSQEHPRKTRQDMFLSVFPTGQLDESGILAVCPAGVDAKQRDPDGTGCGNVYKDCATCRCEFWMQEV